VLAAFRDDPVYARLFPAAFPSEAEPFTRGNLTKALASFQRTIVSARSPYDRYRRGAPDAISESSQRGEIIFFSGEKAGCFQCHGGWNFSGPLRFEGRADTEIEFHNTALHNLDGAGSYAPRNTGIHEHTGRAEDLGRFRAPTLRNIAVTAPYMHDGSLATLEEVIAHYAAGGRAARNAQRSPILRRFRLTPEETADLIAFLNSLTDEALLRDPRWSDPWPPARP
jgi:cytochrome c peroxidase